LTPEITVPESHAREMLRTVSGGATLVSVCHPFHTLGIDDCGKFLELVCSIPPNCVQCHSFVEIEDDVVLTQLHAFRTDDDFSLPRLICIWHSGSTPKWKFVGLIRSSARYLIGKLEQGESVLVDSENGRFADDLQRAYAPFIVREGQRLRLDVWEASLAEDLINESLQVSFDLYAAQRGSWLREEPGTLIRLRSGKLVRRYINISELLHSNDMLAKAVGRKLALHLSSLVPDGSPLRIVTDSEGSYFLARHLLSDQAVRTSLQFEQGRREENATCLGFVDAIHRGTTIARLISQEKSMVSSICAVDLRLKGGRESIPGVQALLSLPFDPIEVDEEEAKNASMILEIDQVTLEPCTPVDLNRFELGSDKTITDLIRSHPEYFRYGLHKSGGRVQIVSPAIDTLVQSEATFLVNVISDRICSTVKRFRPNEWTTTDIVLFCRADAQVRNLLPNIADCLRDRFSSTIYSSSLAVAYSSEVGT